MKRIYSSGHGSRPPPPRPYQKRFATGTASLPYLDVPLSRVEIGKYTAGGADDDANSEFANLRFQFYDHTKADGRGADMLALTIENGLIRVSVQAVNVHNIRILPDSGLIEVETDGTFKLEIKTEATFVPFQDAALDRQFADGKIWNLWVDDNISTTTTTRILRHVRRVSSRNSRFRSIVSYIDADVDLLILRDILTEWATTLHRVHDNSHIAIEARQAFCDGILADPKQLLEILVRAARNDAQLGLAVETLVNGCVHLWLGPLAAAGDASTSSMVSETHLIILRVIGALPENAVIRMVKNMWADTQSQMPRPVLVDQCDSDAKESLAATPEIKDAASM